MNKETIVKIEDMKAHISRLKNVSIGLWVGALGTYVDVSKASFLRADFQKRFARSAYWSIDEREDWLSLGYTRVYIVPVFDNDSGYKPF